MNTEIGMIWIWILLDLFVFTSLEGTSNDHYNDYYNDDIFLLDSKPQQVDILDDLPLQDARILRDTEQEETNMSTFTNITTTLDPFETSSNDGENNPSFSTASEGSSGTSQEWIEEAIKDIAYYLRAHKFNEYDRRYEPNGTLAPHTYHREYPRPPMRSLHWEVHKFCDESFLACIKYLWTRVQGAELRRGDDTAVVIQDQRWDIVIDRERIEIVEAECQKLKRRDNIRADPFQGPLERFQWRSTAIYFMCWYTMKEVEHLRHIAENCDNFASCLDPIFGASNHDPRANDKIPFACALYSFCPDVCCQEKHTSNLASCWSLPKSNPCFSAAPPTQQSCLQNKNENVDFTSTILNQWNVTCTCPKAGFVWDSIYGICVDVDECQRGDHKCNVNQGEACLNTVGGFRCVCKWGHTWSNDVQKCEKNEAISQIKLIALKVLAKKAQADKELERSYLRRLYKYINNLFVKKSTNSTNSNNSSGPQRHANYCLIILIFIVSLCSRNW